MRLIAVVINSIQIFYKMTNKEQLKQHLVRLHREERIKLENFINNEISEKDAIVALDYISKHSPEHKILDMNYDDKGLFSISLEIGVTFLN